MDFPDDQIRELVHLFPDTQQAAETGTTYFLIPRLPMPEGRAPDQVDALLCPTERDGYSSRLFLSQEVTGGPEANWNAKSVRILERNWFAVSWRVPAQLRLAQMVAVHLRAL